MTLDIKLPIGAFDAPTTFGSPWHGPVQGGTLTLPNAATRAFPQPSGSYHWEYTAAHALVVPGAPVLARSPAETAADAAAGRQWLNYALLSGGASSLYGRSLGRGRFVYVDPAGDRWLINASALDLKSWSVGTIPAIVAIGVRRFGVLGTPASETSYSVPVPDLGQSGTAVYSTATTEAIWFDSSLYALHPQGEAAVFMLHYECNAAWPANRAPCGWYELQISGPGSSPTLSIVRLHSRLETLGGTGSSTTSSTPGPLQALYKRVTTQLTGNHEMPSCGGLYTVTYDVSLADSAPGPEYSLEWQYGTFGAGFAVSGSAARAKSYAGMVLGVWYDKDGVRQTLTLDMQYNYSFLRTGSGAGSTSQGISIYDSVPGVSACQFVLSSDAPYSLTLAMSDAASESITYAVRLNGAQIYTMGASYSGTSSASMTFSGSNVQPETWTYSGSSNHALTGAAVAGMPSPAATITESSTASAGLPPAYVKSEIGINMDPDSQTPGKRALYLYARAINSRWADPPTVIEARIARIGSSAVGVVRRTTTSGASSFDLLGTIVTPAGAQTAPAWSSAGAATPSTPIFVALHPDSGTVQAATQPICYV